MEKAKITKSFPAVKRLYRGEREIDIHCFRFEGRVLTMAEIFMQSSLLPSYRIFMDVNGYDYFTEDLTKTKQKYTSMDIVGINGWRGRLNPAQGREEIIAKLSKHLFGTENIERGIEKFQSEVKNRRLYSLNKEKDMESWRIHAAGKKEPGNFEKWVRRTLEPGVLAFVNKEDPMAVCECGRMIPKGISGHKGMCPHCGEVTYHYLRQGDNCRKATYKTAHLIQPYQDGYVVRSYSYEKHYIKNKARYRIREQERNFFLQGKILKYGKTYNDSMKKYIWEKSYRVYHREEERLYPYNLDNMDGIFQYAALDLYAKGPVRLISYLENFMKHSVVESYVKLGLINLLNDNVPDIKGVQIKKSTGLNSAELRMFRKLDLGNRGMNLYRMLQEEDIKTTEEEFVFLLNLNTDARNIKQCLKGTTAKRLIRYLKQEKRSYKWETLMERYKDYITMARELRYNMDDEFVRFPKNIGQAHNIATEAMNEKNAREKEKRLKKQNRENDKMIKKLLNIRKQIYSFESKNYTVIVPETALDIIKEGQNQHHCVASYVNRVAKAETTILFLRQKKEPEQAFYTVEVQKGKLIQCRGKYNQKMTDAVMEFIEGYKKTIEERWQQYERSLSPDDTRRVG